MQGEPHAPAAVRASDRQAWRRASAIVTSAAAPRWPVQDQPWRYASVLVVCLLSACTAVSASGAQQEKATAVSRASAIHLALAQGYLQRGEPGVALGEINAALQDAPNNAQEIATRALIESALGENDAALHDYRAALVSAPASTAIRQDYGWLLCSQGNYVQAIAQFRQALQDDAQRAPSIDADIELDSGICEYRAGNLHGARLDLQQALLIKPLDPAARTNLALVDFRSNAPMAALREIAIVNGSAGANAQSLWLGVLLAHHQSDWADTQRWSAELINQFPSSRWAILAEQQSYGDTSIFKY